MSFSLRSYSLAYELIEKHGTKDPIEIAEGEGITVSSYDLGSLNGMYTVIKGRSFIALSSRLSDRERDIVCAHELGHHFFHKTENGMLMTDLSVLLAEARPEYEANRFAADLLISDKEFFSACRDGDGICSVAARLSMPTDLVAIKCDSLRDRGENFNMLDHSSIFLK